MQPRPRPPFLSWPVQVYDPVFGFAWFAHPAVLATQVTAERGSKRVATHIHDVIDLALEHARDEIDANGGLFIVHDFRAMTGYDKEGRLEFFERMRRRGPGYSRGSAVAVRLDVPLLRMAVQGANLVSAMVVKAPLQMVEDPALVLEARVEMPPAPGERFPGT